MTTLPIVKSILLCLSAEKEPLGTWTLRGVGCVFSVPKGQRPPVFPVVAYIQVTEIYGSVILTLQVVDAETEFVGMYQALPPLSAPSPTAVVSDVVRIPNFELPKPGDYFVRLLCENEVVGELRLTLLER